MKNLRAPLAGEAALEAAEDDLRALLDDGPINGGALIPAGGAFIVPEDAAEQLGRYVQQLGRIVAAMQRRMDDLERESARRVTISHAQALALQKRIRARAAAICARYDLGAPGDQAAFRAAIKRAILQRYAIRDLHDLPLAALDDAGNQADTFTDARLMLERRAGP